MLTKKKEAGLTPAARDPFALFRQMTSDFERMLGEPFLRWPAFQRGAHLEAANWFPQIDVFAKDDMLVTRIDLPGMKKEDVKVEIANGRLTVSGERKTEAEEKKDQFYRCEREYGSFFRTVPLPEGVQVDAVKARFENGVLEIRVPLPVAAVPEVRKVEIEEPPVIGKTAA